MTKRKFSLLILHLLMGCLFAQPAADTKKYSLVSVSKAGSLSIIDFTDPYLSPINYSGLGLGYTITKRKYFKPDNIDFSMRSHRNIIAGIAFNPAVSSSMTFIGSEYSWGAFYHYRKLNDIQILAGSTIDGILGFKSISRNVNNPINADAAVNLNLAAQVRYDFRAKRTRMRLNYEIETPIAGCMFVPVGGASYYEMFELWNLKDAIHFSSLHNKSGLKSSLTLAIYLKKSTLSVGFGSQNLMYEANNLVFKQQIMSLHIGYKYDFYSFKGRKNPAPINFISTEK